jgi:hypothetical protein
VCFCWTKLLQSSISYYPLSNQLRPHRLLSFRYLLRSSPQLRVNLSHSLLLPHTLTLTLDGQLEVLLYPLRTNLQHWVDRMPCKHDPHKHIQLLRGISKGLPHIRYSRQLHPLKICNVSVYKKHGVLLCLRPILHWAHILALWTIAQVLIPRAVWLSYWKVRLSMSLWVILIFSNLFCVILNSFLVIKVLAHPLMIVRC